MHPHWFLYFQILYISFFSLYINLLSLIQKWKFTLLLGSSFQLWLLPQLFVCLFTTYFSSFLNFTYFIVVFIGFLKLLWKSYWVWPTLGGTWVKNPLANAGDAGDAGSIPGSGRSPGVGDGNPLQLSCWEISWTEEPCELQSMKLQRVGHDWGTEYARTY